MLIVGLLGAFKNLGDISERIFSPVEALVLFETVYRPSSLVAGTSLSEGLSVPPVSDLPMLLPSKSISFLSGVIAPISCNPFKG